MKNVVSPLLSSSGRRRLLSRLMLVWSELVIKYSAISDRHTHKHCSGYLTLHNPAMQVILLPRKKQKELTTWCRTSSTASRSRWPRLPATPRCCRRWRRRRAGTWTVDTVISEEHSLKTEAPQRVNVTPVDARYSLLVTLLGSNWYCDQALRLGLGPGSAESEEEDTYHILFKTSLPRK